MAMFPRKASVYETIRQSPQRSRACAWPAFLLVVCATAAPARAQVFESVGARALGMAGAFVGVADDGTATYWNPAGLGTGTVVEACAGYGRSDRWPEAAGPPGGGHEGGAASLCLAAPVIAFSFNRLELTAAGPSGNSTAGGSGSRQDLRPQGVGVSSLTTAHYGLTLVQTVMSGVTIGATFKVVSGNAGAGQVPEGPVASVVDAADELERRTTTTFDADVGVMAGGGPVRVGLTVRNIRQPSFQTPAGESLELARQARVGVAWTPGREAAANRSDPRGLVFAFDADLTRTPTPEGGRRNVAVGAERWWWGRRLGLRAGARASTVGAARPVAAAGVSIRVTRAVFLEAAGTGGHQDGDRGWFVGIRAGL